MNLLEWISTFTKRARVTQKVSGLTQKDIDFNNVISYKRSKKSPWFTIHEFSRKNHFYSRWTALSNSLWHVRIQLTNSQQWYTEKLVNHKTLTKIWCQSDELLPFKANKLQENHLALTAHRYCLCTLTQLIQSSFIMSFLNAEKVDILHSITARVSFTSVSYFTAATYLLPV